MCRKLVSQLCHGNKGSFKSVIISANDILQKQQYVHGFKHDITIPLHSLVQLSYMSSMTPKVIKKPFIHLRQ